jgi:hypothetical protein
MKTEEIKDLVIKQHVTDCWHAEQKIYDLLINGFIGYERMTASELNVAYDRLIQEREKENLIGTIMYQRHTGEEWYCTSAFLNGFDGYRNKTIEELKKIAAEEYDIHRQFWIDKLISLHTLSISGAEWYLTSLIRYGFKGYLNYSNSELTDELEIRENQKSLYLDDHYRKIMDTYKG